MDSSRPRIPTRPSTVRRLLYENGDSLGLDSTPVVYDASIFKESAHLIIGLRHQTRSNAFYADGHVELFDSLTLKDEAAVGDQLGDLTSTTMPASDAADCGAHLSALAPGRYARRRAGRVVGGNRYK